MAGLPILVWSATASLVATSSITEVVVTESAPERDPSATATPISKRRLLEAERRGQGVGELLDTVAGARALDFGGPLGERRLTVRGGAPAQLLTVVDGVALGSSFATGVDLGEIPAESVGSMRVLRGGQGALYGDGALTGVLLIDSERPRDRLVTSASLTGGSFGTVRAAGRIARAPIAASASYEQTEGGFDYADRAFGLEDVERTRINNDGRRGSLSLSAEEQLGDNRIKAAAAGAFRRAGVPGLISDQNPEARESRWSGHARVAVDHALQDGLLSLSLGAALLSLDYEDPALALSSQSTFVTTSMQASAQLALPGEQIARALAEVGGEIARSTEHGAPSRFRWSLALSDELALGAVTLFAGARASGVTGQGAAFLPRAGVRWEPVEGLSLRLGLGRSLRTPTIDELYRPSEAGFSGNPALIAESAWEAEAGVSYERPSLRAGAVIFARSIADVILYVNRNAFEVRPENLGDARALGGELELEGLLPLGPVRLGGSGSVGLLWSELVETGERLPTQPVWSSASQVDIGFGPVTAFTMLRIFGPTSTRPGSDRQETQVPAYLRWDAGLEVTPLDWLTLAFRCTNLLDDRGLVSVNKIPLPGRAFFFTLSLSTGGDS